VNKNGQEGGNVLPPAAHTTDASCRPVLDLAHKPDADKEQDHTRSFILSALAGTDKAGALRSFGVVRSLAWAALTLTIILSIVLATYLGNTASNTLLKKNHDFASLLADNLNNQIYRRFTLPTLSIFGRIALRNPEQYRALDQIVHSIIQGLHVSNVRIFSHDHEVAYSTNQSEMGSKEYATQSVDAALSANNTIFTLLSEIPYWQAFFNFNLEKNTFRLRTTFPLRIENKMLPAIPDGTVMGVMEFTQDLTRDFERAIRFQQMVLGATLLGSGMLMAVLLLMARRAERALAVRMAEEQRLILELHQNEKLASTGRVVASIAHEIRNPLGIISSSAELLLKKSGDSAPGTKRILQAIYDEARRLSRTVSDFLDYAKPRQPKKEPVDVSAVIIQALSFLSPDMNDRDIGVVRAGILDKPLNVTGDKDLLYRAFYNILGNAIQAMGASGTLTIEASRTLNRDAEVELIFQDSGPGFPEAEIDRLLDPFYTTKDDGTGLGLPIVNNIIHSHGGRLELRNAPHGGAEVHIFLPEA